MGKRRAPTAIESEHGIDALTMILQTLDAIDQGEPVPPRAAAPLAKGLQMYLEGQGPLDKCLGFRSRPGGRTQPTQYRAWLRNSYLRKARAICEGESDWARSCALAVEIRRYGAIIWPRQKELNMPPLGASELRTNLFYAFKTGARIPETERGIHEALKQVPCIRFTDVVENSDCEQPNLEE